MLRDVSFSKSTFICQYPDEASSFEKKQASEICENFSSAVGRWKCSRSRALFNGRRLRQMRNFPLYFSAMARPFTQSFGYLIGSIMSRSTIRMSSFPSFRLSACGTLQTGVTTGLTLSYISLWWATNLNPKIQNNDEILRKDFHKRFSFYKFFL